MIATLTVVAVLIGTLWTLLRAVQRRNFVGCLTIKEQRRHWQKRGAIVASLFFVGMLAIQTSNEDTGNLILVLVPVLILAAAFFAMGSIARE